MRSPCCGAEVETRKARYDRDAWWYACTACGQPCDPVEDVNDVANLKWVPIPLKPENAIAVFPLASKSVEKEGEK